MYFSRKLNLAVQLNIDNDYILLILGARQTGKTTLLKHIYEQLSKDCSAFFINLENPEYKKQLSDHPENLYKIIGVPPKNKRCLVFIDEIQYLDDPSNFLKFIYDEHKDNTKLIVSGSSSFYIDRKFRDSLAGRKKVFHLYSLNFGEFLEFKGEHQVLSFLKKKQKNKEAAIPLIIKNRFDLLLAEYIQFGGYPRVVLAQTIQEKKDILEGITFDYLKKDIFEAGIKNEEKYFHLFKILAHQTGQLVNVSELASTLGLSKPTVDHYLYVMQKSFQIALIKPFYRNVRSELTKMPKVYFYDLGICNQFLNNFQAIESRQDKGAVLENIFFKEMVFKEKLDNIKYWRTQNKNEVDFIVREEQAYEIKFQEKLIKPAKYKTFQTKFPEVPLEFVTYNSFKEKFIDL